MDRLVYYAGRYYHPDPTGRDAGPYAVVAGRWGRATWRVYKCRCRICADERTRPADLRDAGDWKGALLCVITTLEYAERTGATPDLAHLVDHCKAALGADCREPTAAWPDARNKKPAQSGD